MRVGIVGAGLNSDYHINFSKAYNGATIVGIADSDLSRARECATKHGIPGVYESVTALLRDAKPDVVHVEVRDEHGRNRLRGDTIGLQQLHSILRSLALAECQPAQADAHGDLFADLCKSTPHVKVDVAGRDTLVRAIEFDRIERRFPSRRSITLRIGRRRV